MNNSHRPMEALEGNFFEILDFFFKFLLESNFAKLLGTATEDQLPTADEIKNQARGDILFNYIV